MQAFTNVGVVLAGGSITTYLAGTTTPTDTWIDSTGVTKNSNPITLDSAGRLPQMIWQLSRVPIKAVFKDANGVQVGPTFDQISGVGDPGAALNTFYGTDTGAANAYAISVASANFSSYVDGTVIYFKAANANTTGSTINVNGLGAVSLFYADGSALGAGALTTNGIAQVMCLGGNFYLLSSSGFTYSSGSFVPTWTGFSVAPTGTIFWTKIGDVVTLAPSTSCTGTSNATAMTITNLPTNLRGSTSSTVRAACVITDNGAEAAGAISYESAGVLSFWKGSAPPSKTGFTNSGTKGLGFGSTITFALI